MITHWPLVALTVLGTIGAGVYLVTAINYLKGKGGEIRLVAIAIAVLSIVCALLLTTLTVGNPSRIFNILGNLRTGFSMSMLSLFLLFIIGLYLIAQSQTQQSFKIKLLMILCIIFIAIVYIGVAFLYNKNVRPALNTWSVYLYWFAFMLSGGSFGYMFATSSTKVMLIFRKVGLILLVVAIVGFVVNVCMIGSADRYITSDELFKGSFSLYFYLLMVTVGLVIPIIFEFVMKNAYSNRFLSFVAFLCLCIGGLGFAVILNSSVGYVY